MRIPKDDGEILEDGPNPKLPFTESKIHNKNILSMFGTIGINPADQITAPIINSDKLRQGAQRKDHFQLKRKLTPK
jgi:hypothetical protein